MAPDLSKKRTSKELNSHLQEPAVKRARDELVYSLSVEALQSLLKGAGVANADGLAKRVAIARVQKLLKDGKISAEALSNAASVSAKSSGSERSRATVTARVARKVKVDASASPVKGSPASAQASSLFQRVGGFFSSLFRAGH